MPTHVIAGVIIQLLIEIVLPQEELFWLKVVLLIVLAFFSHFIIDAAAKATYHPPDPLKDDRFWIGYHVFVYLSAFVMIIILLPWFWLGILAANAVDIWDWYFLRPVSRRKNDPNWGKRYRLHPLANFIRKKAFFFLPNMSHDRRGTIPEIVLILSCFIFLVGNYLN
jgi:hypothetical protein